MKGVAPELAVGERPFLERSQGFHTLVRLPQQAEPEHADSDHEQRRAHEGDEQLEVNPRRQTRQPPGRAGCLQSSAAAARLPCCSLLRHVAFPTRAQMTSSAVLPTILVISQRPSILATSKSPAGDGRHLSRVDVDEVALEVQRAPVSVDRDLRACRPGDPKSSASRA